VLGEAVKRLDFTAMESKSINATPHRLQMADAVTAFRAPLLWIGISGATWAGLIGSIFWLLD